MWPIGPEPFFSTDMQAYYHSLAMNEVDPISTTGAATESTVDGLSNDSRGLHPLGQLVGYMAWTILGPSTAFASFCALLFDRTSGLEWKIAILATSIVIAIAPYIRSFLSSRLSAAPPADKMFDMAD